MNVVITKVPCISWEFEYMLRLISFWPDTFNFPVGIILWLTWITIIPFQVVYITEILDNAVELMIAICDIASEIALFIKLGIVLINRKILIGLIIEMAEDWKKSNTKITRETQAACFIERLDVYAYCGVIVMFFPKLVIAYLTDIPENRQFVLKTSYPFVAYRSPIYEIIVIIHIIQGMLMAIVDVLPPALLVALVCHSGAQLNLLEKQINQFLALTKTDNITDRKILSLIRDIVTKHKTSIDFVNRIEKIFSIVSLIHCLCNGVTIGCSGLVFVTSKDPIDIIRFAVYLVMKLVYTFGFCYAGEYLTNK
ncbi:hypothetical protein PV326_000539, partial [Microctonus aethiopoides]